jgi:hypothetical protein
MTRARGGGAAMSALPASTLLRTAGASAAGGGTAFRSAPALARAPPPAHVRCTRPWVIPVLPVRFPGVTQLCWLCPTCLNRCVRGQACSGCCARTPAPGSNPSLLCGRAGWHPGPGRQRGPDHRCACCTTGVICLCTRVSDGPSLPSDRRSPASRGDHRRRPAQQPNTMRRLGMHGSELLPEARAGGPGASVARAWALDGRAERTAARGAGGLMPAHGCAAQLRI